MRGISLKNFHSVNFRKLCSDVPDSRYVTRSFHSYPAQLIPQIPYYFLQRLRKNRNSAVFDPFCGTGTVLVEAMLSGWDSIGVEINPVAALVAKVRTTLINRRSLDLGLQRIEKSYKSANVPPKIPDFENADFWFEKKALYELARIRRAIESLEDPNVMDFYKVAFSSIIKKVSRADPRIYVPVLPRDGFIKKKHNSWRLFKEKSISNIERMQKYVRSVKKNPPACQIYNGNIVGFRKPQKVNIGLIVTSPPYISAQKYVRSTRLEAYWLGYDKKFQQTISQNTIGTERVSKEFCSNLKKTGLAEMDDLLKRMFIKNQTRVGIVTKYFIEMREVIQKIYSLLAHSGTAVIVVGSNTVMGTQVQTNEMIAQICEETGFKIKDIMVDKINSRGLMTKRNTTANIIDYEWVIEMQKA